MRFDSSRYFKFTVLEDMEDLVGKTIKSFHEDDRDDYFAFLTDDNCLLAFSARSGYESYAEIEIMDINDISYTMNGGKVDSFYTLNELIDTEGYKEDYQASLDKRKKTEEEIQRQREYQQYLDLKSKFESN